MDMDTYTEKSSKECLPVALAEPNICILQPLIKATSFNTGCLWIFTEEKHTRKKQGGLHSKGGQVTAYVIQSFKTYRPDVFFICPHNTANNLHCIGVGNCIV